MNLPTAKAERCVCGIKPRWLLSGVSLIAIAWVAWCCGFVVGPHQRAFVLSFGEPVRGPIARSGLLWKAPWQRVFVLDTRTHLLQLPPVERSTADRHPLVVQLYAVWRVSSTGALAFMESVGDDNTAHRYLNDLLLAELDRQISGTQLAEWLDPRGDEHPQAEPSLELCATRVAEACRPIAAKQWGIDLTEVRVQRISMPERLRESMLAHMHAVRERRRQVEYIHALLQARQILAAARVDAESVRRRAVQEAGLIRSEGRRQADGLLNDARREHPQLTDLIEAVIVRREQPPSTTPPATAPAPLSVPPISGTQPAASIPAP